MKKYIQYFSYLFRHKWFVFVECWKRGLIWQGIVHDYSKFFPDELIPYANYFYGGDKRTNAFYNPEEGTYSFNVAWLKHIHRNPHHFQHWVLHNDDGTTLMLPMPSRYMIEMLCDWIGAGKARNGSMGVLKWYTLNKDKIMLADINRMWIEREIGYASDS